MPDKDLRPRIARVFNRRTGKFIWTVIPREYPTRVGRVESSRKDMLAAFRFVNRLNEQEGTK